MVCGVEEPNQACRLIFGLGITRLASWRSKRHRAQYELTRHGLRKLAWFGQVIDAGLLAHTIADNRHWGTRPVVV